MKKRIWTLILIPCIALSLMVGSAAAASSTILTEATVVKEVVSGVGIPVYPNAKVETDKVVCYLARGKQLFLTKVGQEWCQISLESYRNPDNKADYKPSSTVALKDDTSKHNRNAGLYYVKSENLSILPPENYLGGRVPTIERTGKTTVSLNVRTTPEVKSDPSNSIGAVAENTTLQITKSNYAKGWHQIYYQKALYYVAAEYVTLNEPGSGDTNDGTTTPTTPTNPNLPDKTETAVPSTARVIFNGKRVEFDAYTINDNNYFKLRDLAYILNGDPKGFDVSYDKAKNSINLIGAQSYQAVGGEMGKGSGKKTTALLNRAPITLNEKEVKLTAYMINNNNYFKLRDIMQLFDIGVGWEQITSTIVIDPLSSYVAP